MDESIPDKTAIYAGYWHFRNRAGTHLVLRQNTRDEPVPKNDTAPPAVAI